MFLFREFECEVGGKAVYVSRICLYMWLRNYNKVVVQHGRCRIGHVCKDSAAKVTKSTKPWLILLRFLCFFVAAL